MRLMQQPLPMKKILLLLASAVVCFGASAQDTHFSQYYYSPLTMNPALTGNIEGTWRVGINYRNQWGSISAPSVYATPSAFADFRAFSGRFSGNALGIGLMLLTDKAGDGQLTTTSAMLSLAYHQALDNSGNFHMSAGGMAGWTQKGIDLTKLDFYDEFTGTGFRPGFASMDPVQNNAFAYTDVAGGIAFTGLISDYSRISLGASIAHLSKPEESFYQGADNPVNQLGALYTAHAAATIGLNNKVYFFPSALYHLQSSAQEMVAGTSVGFNISPSRYKIGTIIYGGAQYRVNDAVIPTVGFMMNGLQFGVSYDITVSDLNTANSGQGGFEVALVYTAGKPSKKQKRQFCPRF